MPQTLILNPQKSAKLAGIWLSTMAKRKATAGGDHLKHQCHSEYSDRKMRDYRRLSSSNLLITTLLGKALCASTGWL